MFFSLLACVVAGGIAGAFGSIGGRSYAGALLVGTVASIPTALGYWYFVARSQLDQPRQAVEFVLMTSVCFGATFGCGIYAGAKRYKARVAITNEDPARRPPA